MKNPAFSKSAVRLEVQQAALAAARVTGWKHVDRASLVARFIDRAPQSSIYRWIAEAKKQPLARTPKEMLTDARSGDAGTVGSVVREIQERVVPPSAAARVPPPLPLALPLPTLDETAAAVVPVMALVCQCIQAGQDVIAKARGVDGEVRNARLLLQAAENLRRSLETAVKLQEAIQDGAEVDEFHRVVLAEVAKADPATAARIRTRLLEVNASYTARLNGGN
ncbi:hypothetical protein [Acidocella sp. KAb 2-4]|uniref:hypothetical protein n=1 Tax=Acidocella sp. KAb 2-4 TaxID=2885158 RepID=UPI001D088F03|nr:hypothetical protein [Acidocella sp. KAb 2-4]MCB5944253.1 hypothetical protein [Acidocella sp. KAb 2-4]